MPPLPVVSGDEARSALERDGWTFERQRGSHTVLSRPGRRSVVIPREGELPRGTLRGIIRDAGLTVDELVTLLER
jgi:predicted RNA binding protein YcfA (HicA-like mRNA interferase family)